MEKKNSYHTLLLGNLLVKLIIIIMIIEIRRCIQFEIYIFPEVSTAALWWWFDTQIASCAWHRRVLALWKQTFLYSSMNVTSIEPRIFHPTKSGSARSQTVQNHTQYNQYHFPVSIPPTRRRGRTQGLINTDGILYPLIIIATSHYIPCIICILQYSVAAGSPPRKLYQLINQIAEICQ